MIALIQRVTEASVRIDGALVAAIGPGMVALVAVETADDAQTATKLAERLLRYRIFADAQGRMNLNVAQIGGALLLVPQFTLTADTRRGLRPALGGGAALDQARLLFDELVAAAARQHPQVAQGQFGAAMAVALVNDGPVTFWLQM